MIRRKDMKIYDLCNGQVDSNQYYKTIEHVAKDITQDVLGYMQEEIEAFQTFIWEKQIEKARTPIEYGLESLMLGVFWQTYGKVVESPYIHQRDSLGKLIKWLKSTGEYDEEVLRFQTWQAFFAMQAEMQPAVKSIDQVQSFKKKVILLADRFYKKVHKELSPYIAGVKNFQSQKAEAYKTRADRIFCMQPPIMYYLNMIGAQMLNKVYHEAFSKTPQKVIFLPGCMPYKGKEKCQAVLKNDAYICQGCTRQCQVHQAQRLAKTYHATTRVIYHESELNKHALKDQEGQVGVIGVACILSLLSGGFKAKRLGYVPQCVLLDYCGCKQHWNHEGLVTQINLQQLENILLTP